MENKMLDSIDNLTLDKIEQIIITKNIISKILNSNITPLFDERNFFKELEKNINDNKFVQNSIDTTTNCLALTVRQNYRIIVVKNFFRKSFRVSWKIVLSIFAINFLNLFL